MDSSERPRHTTGTSELFICFTSRPSSSSTSMKISSKSILSPGCARDGPVSLSTSISRRLKTNRSLRGGQSPMFPAAGKRRGSAVENPEPSSPKVTCIGQVRVKSKKQGKKIRTLSKRGGGGEVGFPRRGKTTPRDVNFPLSSSVNQHQQLQESLPHHRNQRWVHLPLTICKALRGLGAEFSCLFPCRPSCFLNGERGKEERKKGSSERSGGRGFCGAVFARWLVPLNEGEGGKRREVELVVGGEEEERREIRERINLRRHVDEERGIEDETCEVNDVGVVDAEEGRVSICIPPKNALLLMRFKSDPTRMSALANRFWKSPALNFEEDEDDDHEEEQDEGVGLTSDLTLIEAKEYEESEKLGSPATNEEENPEADMILNAEECEGEENPEEKTLTVNELRQEAEEEDNQEPGVETANQGVGAEENGLKLNNFSSGAAVTDPDKLETEDSMLIGQGGEARVEERESRSSSALSVHLYSEDEVESEALTEVATLKKREEDKAEEPTLKMEKEEKAEKSVEGKDTQYSLLNVDAEDGEEMVTEERSESEETQKQGSMDSEEREVEEEEESNLKFEREISSSSSSTLSPDCLLLMRCEPKLSMEVSKETWVCTTDFIRWLPERKPKARDGGDELKKKRVSLDSNSAHYQPPRSSCTLPAAVAGVSMGTMIEQKLAVACEPLVLTRCKSEPRTTAAALLKPESCFWKNRKLEPHRVGAARVGF